MHISFVEVSIAEQYISFLENRLSKTNITDSKFTPNKTDVPNLKVRLVEI